MPVSLLLVITAAFAIVPLLPGDPALLIVGDFASPEQLEQVREDLGLNDPLWQRYVSYIGDLARGDLGTSFVSRRPVLDEIGRRLPNTLELIFLSLAVAFAIGLAVGTIGAYFRGRTLDRVSRVLTTLFQSIPDFLLALFLIFLLYYTLRIVPSPVGRLALTDGGPPSITGFLLIDLAISGEWAKLGDALRRSALPVATLGIVNAAYFAKIARATMAESLRSPHVEFARASGLRESKVLWYAFMTARNPMLTYGALLFGSLFGGVAIVEFIFAWHGLGEWALQSILARDIPAIQGFVIVAGFFTLLVFFILDIVILMLDPRVEIG